MSEVEFSTRVIQVDPKTLKLLDVNARYMRNETFLRLVDNIKSDGRLTQIPFAWHLHDDNTQTPAFHDDDTPIYEVLSGNHRVKAAVAANLPLIDLQVTDDYLPPARRNAVQLSHNAIVGEDDPATLKLIYDSIDDVQLRLYAGLDDKTMELLDSVQIGSLSEASLEFQTVSMVFLPDELELVTDAWEAAENTLHKHAQVWLARFKEYDAALDAIEAASAAGGVTNVATSFMMMLNVFWAHIEDLRSLWLEDGEPVDPKRAVPIDSVISDTFIPADIAARLDALVERLIGDGDINPKKRWEALRWMLDRIGEHQ